MQDYVKDYFDRNAAAWVEGAYAGGSKFPVGPERVRLAIEGVAPAMREGAALVDLGCGGGQLSLHTAREIERGEAGALLAELTHALEQTDASGGLHALAEELAAAAPELAEAARRDAAEPAEKLLDHERAFGEERRQHTPAELAASA